MKPSPNRNLYREFKNQKLLQSLPKGKITLAVSGGPDSVALLHLMRQYSDEKKWGLGVVHVQHHLRGKESARDQQFVQSLCQRLNVPCIVRSRPVPKNKKIDGAGIEECARTLRYRALAETAAETGSHAIFTAHTANDQAETFFLHLLRGAGSDGLCGILPSRALDQTTGEPAHSSILLIRPLLAFTRETVLDYLSSQKSTYCKDSSNLNVKFRRNWVRHRLFPMLQKVQPKMVDRISNLTSIFQDEKEWWDLQLQEMHKKVYRPGPEGTGRLDLIPFFSYHISLRKKFIHHWLPHSSYAEVCQILTFLEKERAKGKTFLKWGRSADLLFFHSQKKAEIKKLRFPLSVPGISLAKEWGLRFKSSVLRHTAEKTILKNKDGFSDGWKACFDADKLMFDGWPDWTLRTWEAGDRFNPLGMKGSKKIQDFFVDRKVVREKRAQVPLLVVGGKIRWVVGYRTDEESKVGPDTKRVVYIEAGPAKKNALNFRSCVK